MEVTAQKHPVIDHLMMESYFFRGGFENILASFFKKTMYKKSRSMWISVPALLLCAQTDPFGERRCSYHPCLRISDL